VAAKTYYFTQDDYHSFIQRHKKAKDLPWMVNDGDAEPYYNIDIDNLSESDTSKLGNDSSKIIQALKSELREFTAPTQDFSLPESQSHPEFQRQDSTKEADPFDDLDNVSVDAPSDENQVEMPKTPSSKPEDPFADAFDSKPVKPPFIIPIKHFCIALLLLLMVGGGLIGYLFINKNNDTGQNISKPVEKKEPVVQKKASEQNELIHIQIYVYDIVQSKFIDTSISIKNDKYANKQELIYESSGYKGWVKPNTAIVLPDLNVNSYEWVTSIELEKESKSYAFQAILQSNTIEEPVNLKGKDNNRFVVEDHNRVIICGVKSSTKNVRLFLSQPIDCDVSIINIKTKKKQTKKYRNRLAQSFVKLQPGQKYQFHVRPIDSKKYRLYQFSEFFNGKRNKRIPIYKNYWNLINDAIEPQLPGIKSKIKKEFDDDPDLKDHPDYTDLMKFISQ